MKPLDFMKFLGFLGVILANESDGAMWHFQKCQKL
jgi:hypothetical protein